MGAGVATSPDPVAASTPTDDFLVAQVFEQLTTTTADGQVAPLLATDWSSSSGGIVWVFDLRSGVRFHDGRPLEAADVVATFASLTSVTAPPDVRARFGGIVSVIALDPTRVEFILRTADPAFSRVVADARASIRPRPATPGQTGGGSSTTGTTGSTGAGALGSLIGTGPFALRSFSPRDRALLVRNPDYWGADAEGHHLPCLDEVQVVFSADVAAEVVALQGGELQLVMALTPELATTVAGDSRLTLLVGPGSTPLAPGGFAGVDAGVTGIVLAQPWPRTSLASAWFVGKTEKP